jgi:mono/diheme cytochrome c family protein
MAQPPPRLERDDMRRIASCLWQEQLLTQSGNPAHGKRVFSEKNCAACHNDASSGAPSLSGRKGAFSAVTMVATLWRHGPQMLEGMKEKGIQWPRFTAEQMSDLIAYVNTGP